VANESHALAGLTARLDKLHYHHGGASLPVDKPQAAVAFLHARSGGVMYLIAHFWERLAFTPPLLRADLHLVVATPIESDHVNINIPQLDPSRFSGALLYVPKAHRADVLALDPPTAAAFAAYISHQGLKILQNAAAGIAQRRSAHRLGVLLHPSRKDLADVGMIVFGGLLGHAHASLRKTGGVCDAGLQFLHE